MRRASLVLLALAALAALTLSACDTVKAPESPAPDPLMTSAYPQNVGLEGLAKQLYVGQPIVRMTPDRPLAVTVPIRNITDDVLHVQYHFIFLDQTKAPLRPDNVWRYIELPARAQRFLEAAALDQAAIDWRVEVRPQQ